MQRDITSFLVVATLTSLSAYGANQEETQLGKVRDAVTVIQVSTTTEAQELFGGFKLASPGDLHLNYALRGAPEEG